MSTKLIGIALIINLVISNLWDFQLVYFTFHYDNKFQKTCKIQMVQIKKDWTNDILVLLGGCCYFIDW